MGYNVGGPPGKGHGKPQSGLESRRAALLRHVLAVTYLPGIVVLLFILADIERGETDLLGGLKYHDISVNREENGFLFWVAVILQLFIAAGLLLVGRLIEKALA